jgi:uncharacterized delta-60 repeat protein
MKTGILMLFFMTLRICASAQSGGSDNPVVPPPGVVITSLSTSDDIASAMSLQYDGKIVISGFCNASFTLLKYTPEGRLDPSFGTGGIVKTIHKTVEDRSSATLVLGDGKILMAGSLYDNNAIYFAMVRYQPDGQWDTTFGKKGLIIRSIGEGDDVATSVALQPDGKIIVAGSSNNGNNEDFALVRFNHNGTMDDSFGKNGMVISNVSSGDDRIAAVTLQPDGKIVAAGSSNTDFGVARYLPNGEPDKTFGVNGIVVKSLQNGEDLAMGVAVQPDGKIVVAGSSFNGDSFDFAIARFTPEGRLDKTFGKAGILLTSVRDGDDKVYALALQPDGKIIVAGSSDNGSADDIALMRISNNGNPDEAFGKKGIIITSVQKGDEHAYCISLQKDQKIVVAGNSNNGYNNDFIIIRYMPNGALDPDFGR